ncbi:MAG: dihydrolipoamide acetyltransferase [Myxococcales bacterium]|nr:dihydrolipoamide acetyltransferase [Myxococcales bacterium]MDP3505377.1 dihydrolipoamide acetyltransferase [Myxococcales bacterium]
MIARRLVGLAAALLSLAPAFAQTPAPGGAPSPAPADSPAAPAAPQTADEAFQTRVKQLEEQVVDLKEKIFRTKARLLLLQETVLGGDISQGARAVIYHRKEMSPQFVLESVAYALDGAPIFTKVDTNDDLNKREEFEIFNGRIVPGNHQIAVRMVYRGAGGVFSYAEGYKFKLQSNQTFTAEGGKITTVKVVGYEKGGITAEMKDKPAIRYDISSTKEQAGSNAGSGDQSAPGAATNPQ